METVTELLECIHLVSTGESFRLAAAAGLTLSQTFEILSKAAGGSAQYSMHGPRMAGMSGPTVADFASLEAYTSKMIAVMSRARELKFPLPIAAAACSTLVDYMQRAAAAGMEADQVDVAYLTQAKPTSESTEVPSKEHASASGAPKPSSEVKVGVVGLGAMGFGMAKALHSHGLHVVGYDVAPPCLARFADIGGETASTVPACASGAAFFVMMVQTAAQAEDVLFGSGDAVNVLPSGATIVLASTVPPHFISTLHAKIAAAGKRFTFVEAPVSGGVAKAADGKLTIITSSWGADFEKARVVLEPCTDGGRTLYQVNGGPGAAASVKMINQLLAGVHIAAAAEAMALAARLGLNTRRVYDHICSSAAYSWMFENRVPAMLTEDWTPHSALAIFTKDMGIVTEEAGRLRVACPLASAAQQLYLFGAMAGLEKEADGGVVRVWERLGNVSVASAAK